MMPLYEYPNTSGIYDLFNYTNANACLNIEGGGEWNCGWFGPIMLFSIFAIVLLSQKDRQPMGNSLALSSFITFIMSVIMLPLGLTAVFWTELFFILLILSVISLWRTER